MPQGTQRQRWFALLALVVAAAAPGCASNARPIEKHPSVASGAKTLQHVESISVVGLGSGDHFKQAIVGADLYHFSRPLALAVRDRVMYVADAGTDVIFRYNLDTRRMEKVGNAGGRLVGDPGAISIEADYSFYITDPLGKQVLYFSPKGKLLKTFRDGPNISRPIAVAYDAERNQVLVADELYSHIVAFDKETAKPLYGMGDRGNGPGRFRVITDMVETSKALYVSDRVEYRMQVLDKSGQFIRSFGQDTLTFPQAVAVDEDNGYVFVADRADNRIKVYIDGKLVDVIGRNGPADGEFRLISDMALSDGRLYVADSLNQRIQVFRVIPRAKQTASH